MYRILTAVALATVGCSPAPPSQTSPSPAATAAETPAPLFKSYGPLSLELVAEGLRQPTALADAGDGRLYVVEQAGAVREILHEQLQDERVLDIRDRVLADGERGLLGIALHPEFASNGRMYLMYSNLDGDTELREFRPGNESLLLFIPQDSEWHQGGDLAFGPDGYLYVSIGDDGRQGNDRADPAEIRGTILRLDVDSEPGSYVVPPDNPFADGGGRPEVWNYGLRNPWRISFDSLTGDLYIGDVGQNTYEEINRHPAGKGGGLDFGWSATEGHECRDEGCDTDGITWPIAVYSTRADGNCAVIGGHVIRTDHELHGHYLYGDLCSGRIWSLSVDEPSDPILQIESRLRISSFGIDASNRIYVLVHWEGGRLYRLTD